MPYSLDGRAVFKRERHGDGKMPPWNELNDLLQSKIFKANASAATMTRIAGLTVHDEDKSTTGGMSPEAGPGVGCGTGTDCESELNMQLRSTGK